ncbi:2-haloalkanoic acid dehalogenase [Ophiostoma piceae UAMH 11346]|uniref:2-haloalkanoic acid dehalogenase n=1 Tax=Ophiostoma piceae (strain UAMH 11346) TaxID=1262450 RepID=S3C1M8_OPHP1|nr:2-haloalkanoic acid dehalogenase [Ophiostoma piceae UAMH 11346]
MASENKHVVFDIVGTCVSYDAFFEAIEARLGDRLRAQNIGPARLFGYAWMETGEKEYTYMSLTNKYVPFFDIFRSIFYRVLGQAGIANPRSFATDDDREFLLASYRTLRPRPGLLECFEKLRSAGYTVWALTSGDTTRVAGYLEAAGAKFPEENFFSCDSIGIGKPAPSAYQFILDKFPKENLDLWFAAAHIWDAAAARQCGFKGAWASVWEGEPSPDIYGEMEVTADSLTELADNIISYTGKK